MCRVCCRSSCNQRANGYEQATGGNGITDLVQLVDSGADINIIVVGDGALLAQNAEQSAWCDKRMRARR